MGAPILVGDVGGTNIRLALATNHGSGFTLDHWRSYATAEVDSMADVLKEYASSEQVGLSGRACCLSGAGPVRGNVSYLSNVGWTIDGDLLRQELGLRTLVINDFSAICYGLPFLNRGDEDSVVPVPHSDGSYGEPAGDVWAAVGAGTGLGIGFLVTLDGRHLALPSEGGHSGFPAFSDETRALAQFIAKKIRQTAGCEQFVSGQGIINIFEYLVSTGRHGGSDLVGKIGRLAEDEKPAAISRNVATDLYCRDTMRLFAQMYGKIASDTALTVLPAQGVFLAGGIAAKNQELITGSPEFMATFETNYKPSVRPFLRQCPVFIVKEEQVALYGAAHAAEQFIPEASS